MVVLFRVSCASSGRWRRSIGRHPARLLSIGSDASDGRLHRKVINFGEKSY